MKCQICQSSTKTITVTSFHDDKQYCEECLNKELEINAICKCDECGYSEFMMSDVEGYEGMCDLCSSNKMVEELEREWDTELTKYNSRSGSDFGFDEFCASCYCDPENSEVKKEHLEGLEELSGIYEQRTFDWIERNKPWLLFAGNTQLELEFNSNDLPF